MSGAEPYGYWTFASKNGLAGVPDDENNPVVLRDEDIIYAIHRSRIARREFLRLFPTMLPAEQTRLQGILDANPALAKLLEDQQTRLDNFSRAQQSPVRTAGKYGGTRIGGNS